MLQVALASVLNNRDLQHLYIVDNAPHAGLKINLPDDKRIIYLHSERNIGFGAGHNRALKLSLRSGVPCHLVLNPDIRFGPEVMPFLLAYMEQHPDVGNVLPKVFYPDGKLQYLCRRHPTPYYILWKKFAALWGGNRKIEEEYVQKNADYDREMEVPFLSGCFMLLNLEAVRVAGLFDEHFFLYFEDADMCRRIENAGFRNVYNPGVSISHEYQKGAAHSFTLAREALVSALYYFRKWGWG